jgi:proline dehydrogenase
MTDLNLFKRIWQRSMIWLACQDTLREWIEGSDRLASLAKRFVAGPDVAAARLKAEDLAASHIHSSIYYLGEYVDSAKLVEENVRGIFAAIEHFAHTKHDWFISVDPTQIGCSMSDELGWANAQRIGEAVKALPDAKAHPMMIDMEDASVVVLAKLHIRSKINAIVVCSGWVAPGVTFRHNPLHREKERTPACG